jgi:CDGSH-type Zn-finger protein
VVAQNGPYPVELEAGKSYSWCACGRSATQPFCDGSHAGTGIAPLKFEATESGTAWLCGCKQTKDKPFCDGSHSALESIRER